MPIPGLVLPAQRPLRPPQRDDVADRKFFGEVLAGRRDALQVRQTELAAAVGLARQTISGIEVGRYWPHMGTFLDLADVLALPPAALLPPRASSVTSTLLAAIPALPEDVQGLLLHLISVQCSGKR